MAIYPDPVGKEYQKSGTVCSIQLPEGLQESQKLLEPIFTPTTKPESGKDENVRLKKWKL